MDPEALLKLLADSHWIEKDDAARLLSEYEASSQGLFDLLEASGVGSKKDILRVVADALNTELVDLESSEFPPGLFNALPAEIARIYRCVPIHDSNDMLKVCLVDPLDSAAVAELANLLKRKVRVVVADPDSVEKLVDAQVSGSLAESPQVRALKTAPVAASMGSDSSGQGQNNVTAAEPRMGWLYAFAALAVAATATSAVYLQQRGTMKAAEALVTEFDSQQEQNDLEHLATERSLVDMQSRLNKVAKDLDRASADAIRISQLEAELRRLEGRLHTLAGILPEQEKPSPEDGQPAKDAD
jgi:hypothetical protein